MEVECRGFDPQCDAGGLAPEGTEASVPQRAALQPPALNPTTSFLTAAALVYAIGAGVTAAAGTRLALQRILTDGFGYHPLQSPHIV